MQSPKNQTKVAGIVKINTEVPYQCEFYEGPNLIGKNQNKNTIVIDNETISDIHCILSVGVDGCSIIDLSSHNGVFIQDYSKKIQACKYIEVDLNKPLFISQIKCQFNLNQRMKDAIQQQKQLLNSIQQHKKQIIAKKQKQGKQIDKKKSYKQIFMIGEKQQNKDSQSSANSSDFLQALNQANSQISVSITHTAQNEHSSTSNNNQTQQQNTSTQQSSQFINSKHYPLKILFSVCNPPKNYEKRLPVKLITHQKKQFDVLVMDEFQRTFKALLAILKGKDIISVDWLSDSLKKNKLYKYGKFMITIPRDLLPSRLRNSKQNILSNSLMKTRQKIKVFNKRSFVILSKQNRMPNDNIKYLIQVGGGQVFNIGCGKSETCIFIVSQNDAKLGSDALMKRFRKQVDFFKQDLIYDSCMTQQFPLNSYLVQ